MVRRAEPGDELLEKGRVDADARFEGAEAEVAVGLGAASVRLRHDGAEDGHGAAEDVDEGLRDDEFDCL